MRLPFREQRPWLMALAGRCAYYVLPRAFHTHDMCEPMWSTIYRAGAPHALCEGLRSRVPATWAACATNLTRAWEGQ